MCQIKEGSYKEALVLKQVPQEGGGSLMQKCVVKEVPCEGGIYEVDILHNEGVRKKVSY